MDALPPPSNFRANYRPLDVAKRHIRILYLLPADEEENTIHVSMKTVSLDDEVCYHALSYCWGTEYSTGSIMINGIWQNVTENLELALRHLRHPYQDLCLWIDALCINQSNVEERNQQVQLMADIYKAAESVIVWLGEASEDSDLALTVSEGWADAHPYEKCRTIDETLLSDLLRDNFTAREWVAVKNLLQRPYWTRTWIYQEVLLARKIQVRCGHRVVPWSCFEGLYETNYQIQRKFELVQMSLPHHRFAVIESTLKIFDQILSLFMNFPAARSQRATMFPMLQWTADLSCKDPRDRIYAILGLVKDAEIYPKPDYSHSVKTIYTEFARSQIIQSQNLNILHEAACRSFPILLSYEVGTPIASWVPKWTVNPQGHIPYSKSYYKAASNIPMDLKPVVGSRSDDLEVQGIHVDKISRVASKPMANFSIPELLAFIDNMNHKFGWSDYRDLKGYKHIYPTGEPLLFVLFRTCLLDIEFRLNTDRLNTAESLFMTTQTAEGFLIQLAYEYGFLGGSEMVREQTCDLRIPPFSLDFDFLPAGLTAEYPHLATFTKFKDTFQTQTRITALYRTLFARHRKALSDDRMLFTTEKGYIGLSTISFPQPGDDVVVLFGCQTPVILRSAPEAGSACCTFISDCFIHGLMDGEVVEGVTAEKHHDRYQYATTSGPEGNRMVQKFIIR